MDAVNEDEKPANRFMYRSNGTAFTFGIYTADQHKLSGKDSHSERHDSMNSNAYLSKSPLAVGGHDHLCSCAGRRLKAVSRFE